MIDRDLRQALRTLSIAAAAKYVDRFTPPMRIRCPRGPHDLPAGWSRRWHCDQCRLDGDLVDYLRSTGMGFSAVRSLILANREQWVRWERRALRQALPMRSVLELLGIPVSGKLIRCLNPQAHRRGDVRPSCTVYPEAVHCFSCGFHADVMAVWQHVKQCDFRTAWETLLRQAQEGAIHIGQTNTVASTPVARDGQDFVPLYDRVMTCCEPLPATRGADYLAGRGIDAEAAHQLGVRWASNAAVGRIQDLLDALPREVGQEAGLLDRKGLFTLRRHRLLFPARWNGTTVWLQGRSTRAGVGSRHRWRSLIAIRPWPLGLELLDADGPVYVGEGSTDWLAMGCRGWITIGVPGAQAIATAWLRLLAGRRVILAHDGDDAGDLGAQLWRERLRPFHVVPERLPLPPGVDPCDFLMTPQSHDPSWLLSAPGAPPNPLPPTGIRSP